MKTAFPSSNVILWFSMFTLISAAALSGCEKEPATQGKNKFEYDGKSYPLSGGRIEYFGKWEESMPSFNYDLILISPGIKFGANGELTGKGNALYFEMFSSSDLDLLEGSYKFVDDQQLKAGTFDKGTFYANIDFNSYTGEWWGTVSDGTVTIGKSGENYEITVDCTSDSGKKLSGYFKGNLPVVRLASMSTYKSQFSANF